MNDKNHNPNDRLEGMLRRWGADEASRQADVPPMPAMSPRPQRLAALLRWGPPLAAAAMLAIAVGLITSAQYSGSAASQKDNKPVEAELARTKADLQNAREESARLRDQLAADKINYNSELATLTNRISRLKRESDEALKNVNSQLADLTVRQDEASALLKQKESLLKQASEKLDLAGKNLTARDKQFRKLLGDFKQAEAKVSAAVSELTRRDRAYQKALADKRKVETELLAMKVRHEVLRSNFQRAYLFAAASSGGAEAPDRRIDLPLRRSALRGARLPARYVEIRPSVHHLSTGRLMDRLEVVLTRLKLLDPLSASEAMAFAALIKNSNLINDIDEALVKSHEGANVRAWLLEARLILAGAEHVG